MLYKQVHDSKVYLSCVDTNLQFTINKEQAEKLNSNLAKLTQKQLNRINLHKNTSLYQLEKV